MNCIQTSVFDIYKIGPGPSSSHTIGPMRAANDFLTHLQGFDSAESPMRIEVELFGSLAMTGKGHGTDRAVAVGLLGEHPESCNIQYLAEILSNSAQEYHLPPEYGDISFSANSIRFNLDKSPFPFSNTLKFVLLDKNGVERFQKVYYSIGGGFIRTEGETPAIPDVPYRYRDLRSFRHLMEKYHLSPIEILLANESAISGKSATEIRRELNIILNHMSETVRRGLENTGKLPGPIQLQRRGRAVYEAAQKRILTDEQPLLLIDAFSLAAAEENAAGHQIGRAHV